MRNAELKTVALTRGSSPVESVIPHSALRIPHSQDPAWVRWSLGLFTVAFGWTGQLLNGLVVDRMFTRRKDAHFRYYAIGALIIVASGCVAPLASGPVDYLLLLGPMKYLMNFGGVFNAALQLGMLLCEAIELFARRRTHA